MKLLFGIFIVVFAFSLFLVNVSLGIFNFTGSSEIPSFSFESNTEDDTVLDRLVEKIEEERQNLSVQELQKKVAAPAPIKVFQESNQGVLRQQGIFDATNVQRQQNNLTPFVENETLNTIAQAKVDDMFALQYFEHESPTGVLFTDLANAYGYEYLAMGENLALGHYKNETALVQAWMDSPGHRANILHDTYKEIGIAVAKGNFEGQEVWLAVQTFGLGLSACPAPDESLKNEIDVKKLEIEELQILLDATKTDLDNTQPKRGQVYENKINQYNSLVEQYNETVLETQNLIVGYNIQVEVFNECADGAK